MKRTEKKLTVKEAIACWKNFIKSRKEILKTLESFATNEEDGYVSYRFDAVEDALSEALLTLVDNVDKLETLMEREE